MKLRTRITDNDREDLQERLVELLGDRKQVEEEKRDKAKHYRDTLKELDARIEATRKAIDEGVELREVEVVEVPEGRYMVTRRIDTDEAVTRRKLTPSELGEDGHAESDEPPAPRPKKPKKRKKKTSKKHTADPWEAIDSKVAETEDD